VAEIEDRKWLIKENYPQVQPADTQQVCDLEANPNDNKHYTISLQD